MGWLTTRSGDHEIYYGDETLDACADFLRRLGLEYLGSELNRLPTLEEILINLEIVLKPKLSAYCSDGKALELKAISAKTNKKKGSTAAKARTGDWLAVPFRRSLFGFVQVLTISPPENGVVGVAPQVSEEATMPAAAPAFIAQFQVELTGVSWNHWIVLGNRPIDPGVQVQKFTYHLPCFVAELKILEALQKAGVADANFRLYRDVGAMHPRQRPLHLKVLTEVMTFLQDHGLLSEEGSAELASGELPEDFTMHSELLTGEGRSFYASVFKKDYQSSYLHSDTLQKLEQLWEQFRGK